MNESRIDNLLRETLADTAKPLKAPDALKTRIKFALNSPEAQKPQRKRVFGKSLAVILAVAAITVTGAVAGSGIVNSVSSHTYHDKAWKDFSDTAAYAEQYVPEAKYVEAFENGYEFESGNTSTSSKNDENNVSLGTFTDLMLIYKKDGTSLMFEAGPVQDDLVYDSEFDTVKNTEGVDVHYREMFCIYLPPDGSVKPTDEEQERADKGEINIGYGSETREEQTYYSAHWTENGIAYRISTYDPAELTEDDFYEMAAEIIKCANG